MWAIDPGNSICGICLLGGNTIRAWEVPPERAFDLIMEESGGSPGQVAIEDMTGYSVPLSKDVIETCKLIGVLAYRFGQVAAVHLVTRGMVKKAIFEAVPAVCIPRIEAKIAAKHRRSIAKGEKGMLNKDGNMRSPSFHYVDDRIVIAAVKEVLNIPTPKPGKRNIYGLTGHSWQALAVACFQIGIFQKNE